MTRYIGNPLTYAWLFLTLITFVSWWIGHTYDLDYHTDTAVTVCVLLIAAVKTILVIRYFMEVRFAPPWLKVCTYGLVGFSFALMLAFYFVRPQTPSRLVSDLAPSGVFRASCSYCFLLLDHLGI